MTAAIPSTTKTVMGAPSRSRRDMSGQVWGSRRFGSQRAKRVRDRVGRLSAPSADDFTDAEAIAAVARITGDNFRLVHRLFVQITRILDINTSPRSPKKSSALRS